VHACVLACLLITYVSACHHLVLACLRAAHTCLHACLPPLHACVWVCHHHVRACLLAPVGTTCLLAPAGTTCLLAPAGTTCLLAPEGTTCLLAPAGTTCLLAAIARPGFFTGLLLSSPLVCVAPNNSWGEWAQILVSLKLWCVWRPTSLWGSGPRSCWASSCGVYGIRRLWGGMGPGPGEPQVVVCVAPNDSGGE